MERSALIEIMQQAYIGAIPKSKLGAFKTRKERVYAAMGYILAHPEDYLTRGLHTKEPLGKTLRELTGEQDTRENLVDVSRVARLHQQVAARDMLLTPPPELQLEAEVRLSSKQQSDVDKLMQLILRQSKQVAYMVYLRLKHHFGS